MAAIRYHVNPATGRANICRATEKDCPHGENTAHGDTKQEARAAYEAQQTAAGENLSNGLSKPKKSKRQEELLNIIDKNPLSSKSVRAKGALQAHKDFKAYINDYEPAEAKKLINKAITSGANSHIPDENAVEKVYNEGSYTELIQLRENLLPSNSKDKERETKDIIDSNAPATVKQNVLVNYAKSINPNLNEHKISNIAATLIESESNNHLNKDNIIPVLKDLSSNLGNLNNSHVSDSELDEENRRLTINLENYSVYGHLKTGDMSYSNAYNIVGERVRSLDPNNRLSYPTKTALTYIYTREMMDKADDIVKGTVRDVNGVKRPPTQKYVDNYVKNGITKNLKD